MNLPQDLPFRIADNTCQGETWWLDGWEPTPAAIERVQELRDIMASDGETPKAQLLGLGRRIVRQARRLDYDADAQTQSTWVRENLLPEIPVYPNCLTFASAANRLAIESGVPYIAIVDKGHASGLVHDEDYIAYADPYNDARYVGISDIPKYRKISDVLDEAPDDVVLTTLPSEMAANVEFVVAPTAQAAYLEYLELLGDEPVKTTDLRYLAKGPTAVKLLSAASIALRTRDTRQLPEGVDYERDIRPHRPYFGVPPPKYPYTSYPLT
jgi:hypothetical protein